MEGLSVEERIKKKRNIIQRKKVEKGLEVRDQQQQE